MPNLRGRCGVNIEALAEGFYHRFIARKMSHDAQFDLTIVGRKEETTRFGDETFAYFLTIIIAHGDILQVGIARRKASCGRDRLVKGCMDMTRSGIDEFGKCLDIRAEQLL